MHIYSLPTNIVFVRHGESLNNALGEYRAIPDAQLSAEDVSNIINYY